MDAGKRGRVELNDPVVHVRLPHFRRAAGGIVGIITKITDKEDTMIITSGENTKLNVLRPYITRKVDKTV